MELYTIPEIGWQPAHDVAPDNTEQGGPDGRVWEDGRMAAETTDGRLRDLEASAFRTGRTLAEHSQELGQNKDQQRTAFRNIDSLATPSGRLGTGPSRGVSTWSRAGWTG